METYEEKLEKIRNCKYMKAHNGEYVCAMDGRNCIMKEIKDRDDNLVSAILTCETASLNLNGAKSTIVLSNVTPNRINVSKVYIDDGNVIVRTDEPLNNSDSGFIKEYSISTDVVKQVFDIIEEMKKNF